MQVELIRGYVNRHFSRKHLKNNYNKSYDILVSKSIFQLLEPHN